jgi:hypothetical protein
VQFKEDHFIEFGVSLALGVAKHFNVTVTEEDKAGMVYGFDIDVDDFLHPNYVEPVHLRKLGGRGKETKRKSQKPPTR